MLKNTESCSLKNRWSLWCVRGFPGSSVVKNSLANAGDSRDPGLIPGSGRSPGGENGNPLQYFCLENSMGRGTWQATVNEIAKSWTRLTDCTTTCCLFCRNNLYYGVWIISQFLKKDTRKKVFVHIHMYTRITRKTYIDLTSKIELVSPVDEAGIIMLNLV